MGALLGRALALAYLCLFPLIGLIVAYIGFCDPDTCWHLALGKWMAEHNQLPLVDPFSSNIQDFVFAGAGRPIMQHEWLSDWIFYRLYACGGKILLLVFVAFLSATSLIVLPTLFMVRSGTPRLVSLSCVLFAVPASLFRLWVRPEIFSVFYLALLIRLIEIGIKGSAKKYFLCLFATFSLLALWANCHALFVLGLAYVFLCLVLSVIEKIVASRSVAALSVPTLSVTTLPDRSPIYRLLGLTLAAAFGSLCNPWQGALWWYVLKIILSPAAHGNKENGPLRLSDMGHITVVPLVVSFIFAAILMFQFYRRRRGGQLAFGALLRPGALYLSALLCALLFRRFTPFALLVLSTAVAALFSQRKSVGPAKTLTTTKAIFGFVDLDKWIIESQYVLRRLKVPGWAANFLGLSLAAGTAWLAAAFLVKVEIPSPSRFFQPACQALVYIDQHRPPGRMLNDSKLGSMMTFCLAQPPDIFIDGRFDSYSRQVIDDYETMRLAKPGYLAVLDRYRIDWIFFPPATPLVDSLASNPNWRVAYRGKDAVIIDRVLGRQ